MDISRMCSDVFLAEYANDGNSQERQSLSNHIL